MSLNLLYRDSDKMAVNTVILTNGYKEINMPYISSASDPEACCYQNRAWCVFHFYFLFFSFSLIQCEEMSIGPIFFILEFKAA